jgi:DNA-binding CsgD family transcriptional regulator
VRRAFAYYCTDVEAAQEPSGRRVEVAAVVDERIERIKAMAEQGKTRAEAEEELGISRYTLRRLELAAGTRFCHGNQGLRDISRGEKMASMYRQGLTLEKIGQTFNITRERVRQILKKQGITRLHGGQSKSSQAKKSAKRAKLDARYLARLGITCQQWSELHGTGLLSAYRNQEKSAKARGIEWGLNLAQWLDIWQTSGKLALRGRGKGKYVMSRIKDEGGYVIGNVHIQLATENSSEAVAKWRGKSKTVRGVFHLYPGSETPFMTKVGRKYLGLFPTEEEATAARMAYIAANGYSIGRDGSARHKAR